MSGRSPLAGMRRLHERGPRSRGLVVDRDGVALGPHVLLVYHAAGRYRCAETSDLMRLARLLSADDVRLQRLPSVLAQIVRALDGGDLVKAQLLGLEIPVGELDDGQLTRLAGVDLLKAGFNPSQPRDERGRWSDQGCGDGGARGSSGTSVQIADAGDGPSDAGGILPRRMAAGGEEESRGRGLIEEEFVDPVAPVRVEAFNAAMVRLRAIDPTNPRATYATAPDWVPKPEDVRDAEEALDSALDTFSRDVVAHSYKKHVLLQREFPEVRSDSDLQEIVKNVVRRNPPERVVRGRTIFYERSTNTLVIANPAGSTIFRPKDGEAYVDDLRDEK